VLVSHVGLSGLFVITGVLTIVGMAVVQWGVPPEPREHKVIPRAPLLQVLRMPALQRLNFGVFALHAVQVAMWVAIPAMLVGAGLAKDEHWKVYLPAVFGSFILMGGTVFRLERKGYLRAIFLGAIALMAMVQIALFAKSHNANLAYLSVMLFVFFFAFNTLEATQPSLTSKTAPVALRGTALGVYNTLQSIGFFVGGAGGGWLVKAGGHSAVFAAAAVVMLAWLAVSWGMQVADTKITT